MSPTGSTQLVSSSVPLRMLSTPEPGTWPCAMRAPHAAQNYPKRRFPESESHSMARGCPCVNAKLDRGGARR